MSLKTKLNPLGALGKNTRVVKVVTNPSSATCQITYNGSTYTQKQLTVKKGSTVSIKVTYSGTTRTINVTINKNTQYTFTRNSSTSTDDKSWTSPNDMTSNGTLGGSSFAVNGKTSASTIYKLFGSGYYQSSFANAQWLIFYNPIPIKVLNINLYRSSDGYYTVRSGSVLYSDDGENWTTASTFSGLGIAKSRDITVLAADSTIYKKYWKLNVTATNAYQGYPGWINTSCTITGYYQATTTTYSWSYSTYYI